MVFDLPKPSIFHEFSMIFHVFSGTPPGATFKRFYVDFGPKIVILPPPCDPAGVPNPPTPKRCHGVLKLNNATSPSPGACPPYPRRHPAGSPGHPKSPEN